MNRTIHVIGGGLAGLTAAITAADGGATVVLHEATGQLGGRARSGEGPYGVNLGPHVVYRGGAVLRFLQTRQLHRRVPTRLPRWTGVKFVDERGVHRPHVMAPTFAAMHWKREAPVDVAFGDWAVTTFGDRIGTQLRHLAGLYTFHHDPGSLSADFVWSRCRQTMGRPDTVRYVVGGWSTLVRALEAAARERGVQILFGQAVDMLPSDGPVVVALPLGPAGRLLDTALTWPSARTALLDLALTKSTDFATLVLDLSSDVRGCIMAERFTAVDASLAPAGVELVQAQLGLAPDAALNDAVTRMERTIDWLGDWRPHEIWRRSDVVDGASGAVDPVGMTWRDRPPIDQCDGRYLAGDAVAAPGLLSEVSVNSGVRAAQLALRELRQRQWAPGWPAVELTPSMRAAVLTAAIPAATATVERRPWTAEPVAEIEPNRTVVRRRGSTKLAEADGDTVVTITVRRRR